MSGKSLLQSRHETVLNQIQEVELACNRRPGSVTLLAVSKTFPSAQVLLLADLGQRAFGENYVQEAVDKIAECADQRPDLKLDWHFIGPIQSNKTKLIAENFTWVHSIEREKIALRLSDQRPAGMPPLQICIQINVSGESSKSGCLPSEAEALARVITSRPNLTLRGIMAIPEATIDSEELARQFGVASAALEGLRSKGYAVDTLSMGMSADLVIAIAQGATMVRVGSAIFGAR
jgi:PLP dependent protein